MSGKKRDGTLLSFLVTSKDCKKAKCDNSINIINADDAQVRVNKEERAPDQHLSLASTSTGLESESEQSELVSTQNVFYVI